MHLLCITCVAFVVWTSNNVLNCQAAPFIIGGSTASRGAYPWTAVIKVNGAFVCGGSLISKDRVLTAKHCTQSRSTSSITVVLGDHDRGRNEGSEQTKSVTTKYEHSYADLTVLKLSSCATLNSNVKTITLDSTTPSVGETLTAAGWGWTIPGVSSVSNALQQVTLPTASSSVCQNGFTQIIKTYEFCGGHPGSLMNVCHGDSGGPIMTKTFFRTYQLSGVVAWGKKYCPSNARYAVYTSVPYFRSWIQSKIVSNPCTTSGGGSGGRGCFPADAGLKLESGQQIPMELAVVGDRVLAMSADGSLTYSDIMMMMHQSPDRMYPYYILQTKYKNTTLRLTAEHMVYVKNEEGQTPNFKLAHKVQVGELVAISNTEGHTTKWVPVTNITISEFKGIYAPVTEEGTLVVDNIVASSYAYLENQKICHAAFYPARMAHYWFPNIFQEPQASIGDIHWYPGALDIISRPVCPLT